MNFNIPYTKHNLIEDDIKAINKVLISDNLTQGPFVSQFEKNFQNMLVLNIQLPFQMELQHFIFVV